MRFSTSLLALLALCISTTLSNPLPEPNDTNTPILESPKLDSRDARPEPEPRGPPEPPTPPTPPGCPPAQKPIAQNLCNSGSPYCCSGSGASQVCGPASQVSCASTTICCINTNGVSSISGEYRYQRGTDRFFSMKMQICAGEIDFTGPVTININL